MNAWFDRFAARLGTDPPLSLDREEAALLLDLAGTAARTAGARQFAPLVTYLAGRAAGAGAPYGDRLALLRAAVAAASEAGASEEPLGLD